MGARLEAISPLRGSKQTLFVNIADMTEEIEVTLLSSSDAMPEYLISLHGETYRLKFKKSFPRRRIHPHLLIIMKIKLLISIWK